MKLTTSEERLLFKQRLKARCVAILRERVDTARLAMESAQEAANNEEKSSAGDKYETGRAMSQTDRDLSAGRMDGAIQDMLKLQSLDAERLYNEVNNGAIIVCNETIYFIATGLGAISFDEHKVIVLSTQSPLSNSLRGKSKGDNGTFNGNSFEITDVF